MQDQVERELKYEVPNGWVLPDASRVTPDGASVQVETVRLHSAYYDTVDRDLLRHGVTLRRRTGDDDTGWHLKVPAGEARTELRLPVDGETVPDEMRTLVRALSGDGPLHVIASLDTERTINRLLSSNGAVLAEIADDTVRAVATGDAAVIQQWREVEIELGDADEQWLRESARWLAAAGAVPSRSGSKLARAVGADALPQRPPDGSLAALVLAHLREQHRAIVRGDIGLRRGADLVHKTRVGTRRFRSVLRIFHDLFDAGRAQHLDVELKWYATALGEMRDIQVMREHLLQAATELPEPVRDATVEHLSGCLDADERAARQELLELLDGPRYAALLTAVRAFVEQPPSASDRAGRKVRKYVRRARKKAAKRLAAAAEPPHDDARTHRARKAAKRGRYTAELAVPALGEKAERLAELQEDVQDRLGELQDAVVAAAYLERITSRAAGPAGFGLGLLWRGEQERAARGRRSVPDLAKQLAR